MRSIIWAVKGELFLHIEGVDIKSLLALTKIFLSALLCPEWFNCSHVCRISGLIVDDLMSIP